MIACFDGWRVTIRRRRLCINTVLLVLITSSAIACSTRTALPAGDPGTVPGPANPSSQAGEVGDQPANENDQSEDLAQKFVGTLPNTLDHYRTHGTELFGLMNAQPWHGYIRMRRCKGCGSQERTKLKIQAISNLGKDQITPQPKNGRVVGRVINVGDKTDETMGIPPGTAGQQDQYYFITSEPSTPTTATMWVAHLTFKSKGVANESVEITKGDSLFRKCPPHVADWNGKSSEGDFRTCNHKTTFLTALATPWFSCDGGCCTAPWPP